jgi:hypothetical protein
MATPVKLTDSDMRELGFTDHREGFWYKGYGLYPNVTLCLTLDKETGTWEELVMNDMFGQPEYYGTGKPKWRNKIMDKIDGIIAELKTHGLPFEVDHREYGYEREKDND